MPSINVLVAPAPAGIANDDQAADAEERGMKEALSNYQLVSMTKTTVDGKDAVIYEFTFSMPSTNASYHDLSMVQLSGNNIWVLTCSADDDIYSQCSNDFNNVVGASSSLINPVGLNG